MTEQRKLAAVMFTDIAGYTTLMSKDEQKALALLQKNRELQQSLAKKHNGEFLKEMGDGTLLCFQSALDAVHCAMDIQESVKDDPDLNLCIGIHLGDIVFKEGDVFGDGVNVASRIEQLAGQGDVFLSENVYQSIKNQPGIVVEFIGDKQFKNVEHTIKIYRTVENKTTETNKGSHSKRCDPGKKAIAVLPFADMSPEKDQEYFCDGIAEEIINALTHVRDMRVIARTSAFSFKGKNIDVREIGRKLSVDFLLEGSVRKAGKNLRITAQLINISDGSHVWSERFDRELTDVFIIQDEIAVKIVEKMKISLGKQERELITKRYTENTEAYNLYLRGRSYWHQFSEYGYKRAIDFFKQALELDPDFALAHANIAYCYVFLGWYYFMDPAEAFAMAKETAMKALAMDEDLSEAHSVLAMVCMVYDKDWQKAEKEFQLAITLNPGSSVARIFYSFYLAAQRKHEESIEEGKKGLGLDPVTFFPGINLGVRFYYARQYENALATMQSAIDLNPNVDISPLYTGLPMLKLGQIDEAYSGIISAINAIGRDHSELLGMLGIIEYFRGNREQALDILDELHTLEKKKQVSCVFTGIFCTVLDRFDEAIQWFEKGIEKHDHLLIFLQVEPLLDKIQSDARFKRILQKIGLV